MDFDTIDIVVFVVQVYWNIVEFYIAFSVLYRIHYSTTFDNNCCICKSMTSLVSNMSLFIICPLSALTTTTTTTA